MRDVAKRLIRATRATLTQFRRSSAGTQGVEGASGHEGIRRDSSRRSFQTGEMCIRCEGGTFWELIDFFENEREFCPSNNHKRPQLEKKNVKFLPKKDPYLLFPFSCNTRNVFRAAVSTVITDLMAK